MNPPPKKPCRACPFRRKSLPGYLGEHDVEEFLGRYRSDSIMECHTTVDYESDKTHLDQIADGDAHYCAGALIMAANECRLSRDPERPRKKPDREAVFASVREMRAHHDTATHRSFITSHRRGTGHPVPEHWADTEPGDAEKLVTREPLTMYGTARKQGPMDNDVRRQDLPKVLHERERLLRKAIRRLERMFPKGTGLTILAFDTHTEGETQRAGHMSYIANVPRAQMIPALREQADRLEVGTDDTAGRGEA